MTDPGTPQQDSPVGGEATRSPAGVDDGDATEAGVEHETDPSVSGADAHPADQDESADQDEPAHQDEGEGDGEEDNPLETEAEIAADYLEELLDIADLDGDIDTYIEGDRAHVSIVSDSTVLVGSDGNVLDALQELTRLAVMTETGDRSRLMLDVAGYREKRRTELVAVADRAVQRIRGGESRVALDPMNPFERKIVHDAVAAAGLASESEGQEPKRHVIVLPTS